jgi:hypothetical protein
MMILLTIIVTAIISGEKFYSYNKVDQNKLSDMGIKGFTALGIALLVSAIIMPFIVKNYYDSRIVNYQNLTDIGAVGDFIGGTTVAFLTAASVVLLLATIIMQRKEIKISQQSIEELVKQTEASVKQAEEARKETQITNETMKRQQFETTFFNVINLHHTILKEINIEGKTGRAAIELLYQYVISQYQNNISKYYAKQLKEEVLSDELKQLSELAEQWFMSKNLSGFLNQTAQNLTGYSILRSDSKELLELYKSIEDGTNSEWTIKEEEHSQFFNNHLKGNLERYKEILQQVNFQYSKVNILNKYKKNKYFMIFNENYEFNPKKELKVLAYEQVYKENENEIGHYYRNLYRLVKLIQEEQFDSDEKINALEKRKYRGILRAQLSSFELLMIFYNVVYSKKGKEFKKLLLNTNFFDDHLIHEDFIWNNDSEELASLDKRQA